jgi:predicted flavoprotein YhiN
MKRTRRQGRLLIALAGKNGPFSLFCAQIGRAATQKGPKVLLIVDFMPNLSDAFLYIAARSTSKRPPHFSALFAFVGDADRGGAPWCHWKPYL